MFCRLIILNPEQTILYYFAHGPRPVLHSMARRSPRSTGPTPKLKIDTNPSNRARKFTPKGAENTRNAPNPKMASQNLHWPQIPTMLHICTTASQIRTAPHQNRTRRRSLHWQNLDNIAILCSLAHGYIHCASYRVESNYANMYFLTILTVSGALLWVRAVMEHNWSCLLSPHLPKVT